MSERKGPLDGVRVIDLGRQQAGPRCAQVLARMGAEVIKIEALGGEESRYHPPLTQGQGVGWTMHNSGKKSLSMNLRTEEGKEALRKLLKVSDVLIQNFRPGTIEKMGFSYEKIKAINPRVVMVNVSAYGQFGPYHEQIGYDTIGQTLSGIAMVSGKEGMPPVKVGVALMDRTTALHSAIGCLAALFERNLSGEGQSIDVCLADTGYSYSEIPVSSYMASGKVPERDSMSGTYQCKDGWIAVSALSQKHWPRISAALGKPEWVDDPRFKNGVLHSGYVELFYEAMNAMTITMTVEDAVAHFKKHEVAAGVINDIPRAAKDPHPWARKALVEIDDPRGKMVMNGDFWHFSRSETQLKPTPPVGAHNEEVLQGILGYSDEEIKALYDKKVIGNWDRFGDKK